MNSNNKVNTLAGVKCPEYQVTTYERNKKGEVIAVKSPLGKLVKFGYDKVGNITSKMDEEGLETLYKYNLVGNLTGVSYADGKTVELSYNALKQLTEMRDWLGTTKIELDELGRATKVTDFEGKEIGYTWDSLGQKEKLVYPDNSEVKYEYTASGKIKQVRSESGVTNYSYDAMGRIMERILPDSTITKYKLNSLGRLTSLTHSRNNEILDQFKYTYDPVGNITQIDKHRAGMEADSGVFEYRYDPLGRLVEAVHGDATKRYRYDELGNRIGSWQNGLETTHSYNARNQLIKTQEGGAVKEYRYDARGNLTDITENGQPKANYTFDATNMMVGAFTAGKGKAEYAYNGFKNRVKKLESLQTNDVTPDPCKEIRYILDMTLPYDNLLMTQGAQNQSFVWGNSLLSANGEEKFHYLQDHLGSPIRLLGGEQNDTALAYDEFGVPAIGIQQNPNNPFGFTGYQMDDVSGLYFAQARYYEPSQGRFGAQDTHWNTGNMVFGDTPQIMPLGSMIPDIEAIMQSGNLYAYALANPNSYVDKDGGVVLAVLAATGKYVAKVAVAAVGGYLVGAGIDAGMQIVSAPSGTSPRERFEQVDWGKVHVSGTSTAVSAGLGAGGMPAPLAFGIGGALRDGWLQGREVGSENIDWGQVVGAGITSAALTWVGGEAFKKVLPKLESNMTSGGYVGVVVKNVIKTGEKKFAGLARAIGGFFKGLFSGSDENVDNTSECED